MPGLVSGIDVFDVRRIAATLKPLMARRVSFMSIFFGRRCVMAMSTAKTTDSLVTIAMAFSPR